MTGIVGRLMSRSGRVALEPIRWAVTQGPWYDNNLAVLELGPAGLRMWWTAGEVDGCEQRPVLTRVATVDPIG
jgi:hypothetical protein